MTTMSLALDDASFLFDFVRRRSSISLDESKLYLLTTRLGPVLRDHELQTSHDLVVALRRASSRRLQQDVIEAMTTNETSFFRDSRPFSFLRDQVLPTMLRRRKESRRLRIWSAACSTGQELYSLAMMIDREFPAYQGWDVQLIGTDIDEKVVKRASSGIFSAVEVRRGLPEEYRATYFSQEFGRWQIHERLREKTRFFQLNLTDSWKAVGEVDLLFMRNVLIYFDLEVKRQLLARAHDSLARDGFIFLGNAETPHSLEPRLVPVRGDLSSCYARSDDR
mgnify:CR=1 FL=1